MRLIDADALISMMKYATTDNEIGVFPIRIGFDAIKGVIDDAPTIDAVEVVRCKDCRHYAKGHCYMYGGQMNDDDYCSHGERQCNYFGEREEKVNGFKSVGQAWNTSQGRWEL